MSDAIISPPPSAQLSAEQAQLLGAWHALYAGPSEAAQAAALREGYDPSAAFEDNLVKVYGLSHIGTQFFALWQAVEHMQVQWRCLLCACMPSHGSLACARGSIGKGCNCALTEPLGALAAGGEAHGSTVSLQQLLTRLHAEGWHRRDASDWRGQARGSARDWHAV